MKTNYPNTTMVLVCAGVLGAAQGISAQESQNTTADESAIEEIIVSATPLNRTADDLTQPVLIVTREDLLLKATNSIGETLANELGLSSTYFGPVAGRPIIRGQDGPRVNVLQAGISTLDVADLSPDHGVPIEPLIAERIEVIRGPATLLYGSAAAGGVVNVIDNRVPEHLVEGGVSGALELRGDTAAEERAIAGRIDGSSGGFAWHLDGVSRESEDIDVPGFATADPADRPEEETSGTLLNSFGDSHSFSGGVSAIGERGFIGISVSRFENDYGLPGPEEEEEEEEGEEGEEEGPLIADGPFIELEQTRYDLRAEYQFAGFIDTAKLRFGLNDYEHSEIEPNGEVATLFENDAWEGRLELSHAAIGSWQGALGVQINDREFSAVGEEAFIPPTDTTSVGVFLFEERPFDWGLLEFGVRVDFLEHDPAADFEDYDETAFSAAIGGEWNFAPGFELNVNLSRSERHPDAAELYSDGAHLATALFEVGLLASGATNIDTEVSRNVDVSVHHHSEYFSWQVGVFYNDIDDYTFREGSDILEDGLPLAIYQQQDAEFYGYEAELNWSPTGADSPWGVRVFSDLVRARASGSDLPRVPPTRLGAELSFAQSRWSAEVSAIYHAQQDDVSTFQTDEFTMLNASVAFKLDWSGGLNWDVFARGTNLLDEDARRSTSFRAAFVPLPGASFHLGLRARFN